MDFLVVTKHYMTTGSAYSESSLCHDRQVCADFRSSISAQAFVHLSTTFVDLSFWTSIWECQHWHVQYGFILNSHWIVIHYPGSD